MDKSNAKQESAVKTITTTLRMSALLPALILIGCQGQNAFKRETNPVKSYADAIGNSRVHKPGMIRETNKPADNSQFFCGPQFQVAIQGVVGNRIVNVMEGATATVQIDVTPVSTSPYTVKSTIPKGAELRTLKEGTSYQLVWKTGVGRSRLGVVKLQFKSPEREAKCNQSAFIEEIKIIVTPDEGAPILSVSAPPQSTIKFGESFKFKISIQDPAGTAAQPPVWTDISSNLKSIGNAESKSIGAKEAVDCKKEGVAISDTTWEFDCAFNSTLIKDAPIESGETLNAVFFVKGKSQRTDRFTATEDGFPTSVQVNFPKKKVDEAPVRRDPEHGVEVAVTPAAAPTPAATPATVPARGVKLKLKPRNVPLPPARPAGY